MTLVKYRVQIHGGRKAWARTIPGRMMKVNSGLRGIRDDSWRPSGRIVTVEK